MYISSSQINVTLCFAYRVSSKSTPDARRANRGRGHAFALIRFAGWQSVDHVPRRPHAQAKSLKSSQLPQNGGLNRTVSSCPSSSVQTQHQIHQLRNHTRCPFLLSNLLLRFRPSPLLTLPLGPHLWASHQSHSVFSHPPFSIRTFRPRELEPGRHIVYRNPHASGLIPTSATAQGYRPTPFRAHKTPLLAADSFCYLLRPRKSTKASSPVTATKHPSQTHPLGLSSFPEQQPPLFYLVPAAFLPARLVENLVSHL